MTSHLLFDKAGVYVPTICPHAIVWQRAENDPFAGVFVPHPENGALFAQVTVIKNGEIVRQIEQKEFFYE